MIVYKGRNRTLKYSTNGEARHFSSLAELIGEIPGDAPYKADRQIHAVIGLDILRKKLTEAPNYHRTDTRIGEMTMNKRGM